jgi:hypothetical protein
VISAHEKPYLHDFETLEAYSEAIVDWKLNLGMRRMAAVVKMGGKTPVMGRGEIKEPKYFEFQTLEAYVEALVDWELDTRLRNLSKETETIAIESSWEMSKPKLHDFQTCEGYYLVLVDWKLDRRIARLQFYRD